MQPCDLELTLLSCRDKCDQCGRLAMEHPNWPHRNPQHTNFSTTRYDEFVDLTWDMLFALQESQE